MRTFASLLLAFILIGAVPAPTPTPLLSLDYTFKVTPSGYENTAFSGQSDVVAERIVATTGTLRVQVMGRAQDGGLTIAMLDQLDGDLSRQPQTEITCELYAGGNVSCTQPPYGVSPDERVVLPLLAPTFYAIDGKGPTKVVFIEQHNEGRTGTTRMVTLTSSAGADANHLDYAVSENTSAHGEGLSDTKGRATDKIVYDNTLHLPVSISYSWQNETGFTQTVEEFSVELNLTKVY